MDQPADGLPVSSVYTNGYTGVKQLVDALVKGGLAKIGIIKYLAENSTSENRFQGYRDALAEHGIGTDERLIVQSDYSTDGGQEAAGRLLQKSSPTAIVTVGDDMAIGALRYCYEHHIDVPETYRSPVSTNPHCTDRHPQPHHGGPADKADGGDGHAAGHPAH